MPKSKALSNRQRRVQQRKAASAKPRSVSKPKAASARKGVSVLGATASAGDVTSLESGRLAEALAQARAASPEGLTKAAEKAIRAEFGVRVESVKGEAKHMMVRSRDGLFSLYRGKALTENQVKAGLAYRLVFERSVAGLKSCLGSAGQPGGGRDFQRSPFLPRDPQSLQMAYVTARLHGIEKAVGLSMTEGGLELVALRAIAGEGRTLRAVAGVGGKAAMAYKAALIRALDVTVTHLRIGERS